MATTTALTRPSLKTALAEALFNDVFSNVNSYYYFISRTQSWPVDVEQEDIDFNIDALLIQPTPVFENAAREDMMFVKKITAADVALSIRRIDWQPNVVFDAYDDRIGESYTLQGSIAAGSSVFVGQFDLSLFGVGWLIEGTGVPLNTFVVSATPTSIVLSRPVTSPTTKIKVTLVSATGARKLEDSNFYCITSQKNVYKCLDNNGGAPSIHPPYATSFTPIRTDDGYLWKYMYTIPGSLNNKFATLTQVPVTTSLKQQYYSRGAITSIVVDNGGSGYQPSDEARVIGDGHATDNVFQLFGISVLDQGAGYTSAPTITSDPPYGSIPFEPQQTVFSGQYISNNGLIYEVLQGGVTGSTPPNHTNSVDAITNGTCALRFVGTPLIGTASLLGDVVSDVITTGILGFIKITNAGTGYNPLNPPAVTITGDGVGATAVASVNALGSISSIKITSRGSGYSLANVVIDPAPAGQVSATASAEVYFGFGYGFIPNVTATPPFTADYQWSQQGVVANNDIIQIDQRFYRVTSAGGAQTLGTSAPVHFSGTEVNGDASLLFIGQTAILAPIANKTRASVFPVVEDGQIVNILVQDPGTNYNSADIEMISTTGEGATVRVDLSIGDVNTKQANNELLAIPGTIDRIDVLHPGSGYVTATVTVIGDGQGCEAEAILEEGRLVGVRILNSGVGYSKATVVISGNELATPAYAKAVVSPLGGHGKNAIQELYAQNIILAGTFTRERNQGFIVNNDYRQFGVIKNLRNFNAVERFIKPSGSTCFNISGNFVFDQLELDSIITDANGLRYRVVALPEESPISGIVNILVQSLDRGLPTAGDVFTYGIDSPLEAQLSFVINPAVDKYSGEIMFLDSRNPYSPTDEQTIAFRTIVQL